LNSTGETIVYNNGDFGSEAQEVFCPDEGGCEITATIDVSDASAAGSIDGSIAISTSSGVPPFQYSIDGGQTFSETGTFLNLAPGTYEVVILSGIAQCTFEETVTVQACEFNDAEIVTTNVPSAASATGSMQINVFSGVPPYQYSIDGGISFVETSLFTGLPIGTYNVVVEDASGVCPIEVGVPIVVDETLNVEDRRSDIFNEVSIYPNPTKDQFTVEFDSFSNENIVIEVYDQLGRMVESRLVANDQSKLTTISLNGLESGAYIVRCLSRNSERSFKLVKL